MLYLLQFLGKMHDELELHSPTHASVVVDNSNYVVCMYQGVIEFISITPWYVLVAVKADSL